MSQPTLHIVHIVECFGGGVSTYLRLVLPELAQQNFSITLICSLNRHCPSTKKTVNILRQHNINICIIPMTRSINPISDLISLVRIMLILFNRKPDIVHTHGSKAGALGRIAAWFTAIPIRLHTPHCFAHLRTRSTFHHKLYLHLERLLGKITTTLLAVSSSEATIAIQNKIVPSGKCQIIPNALPIIPANEKRLGHTSAGRYPRTKKSLGLNDKTFIVTTVTRTGPAKGLTRFLKLANSWPDNNTHFLIAGVNQPANTRQKSNIYWLGFCRDIKSIYKLSDVIVLASDAEGQSYALLESMQAGCAVLATHVPGNIDLIHHHKTGLLVDTTSDSLHDGLVQLHNDPVLRQRLGENAHDLIFQKHKLNDQAHRLADSYRTVSQMYCKGNYVSTFHYI